ncbi:MAG: AMP-binding protein [Pseudomonadota bacterium]|nr:AMP-binding protein [Pseudomonadota bacterium]
MLNPGKNYKEVYDSFHWEVPEFYNIGVDICDKWARDPDRLALIYENETGKVENYTFKIIKEYSDKLANTFTALGLEIDDRVAILLPQRPETAISHIAAYKIGAIAIPIFTLFGTDALSYRLQNSGAKLIITDKANLEKIDAIWPELPHLEYVMVTDLDNSTDNILSFWQMIEKAASHYRPVQTKADDPALIIYTSGTTGPPKGALHAHRTLLGHLPGVEFPHNFFPRPGDLFWTPADWAWIGGLIDVLFPSWHHGIPVLAHRARKFDPEQAFQLMAKHQVRNVFMPPTALKMMRQVKEPQDRYDFHLRSIGSGGETLGEELLNWGRKTFGLTINEFYGQTECNLIVGCSTEIMEVKPGSMGRAIPGHQVEIIDGEGEPVSPGVIGQIAVKSPDPVMFLQYWQNSPATRDKFLGDWLLTGDLAKKDEDGYFWFNGRADDVITSSGYRIGPAEIEDCLMKHPAVSMVAVVGSPDKERTEIVKAFIIPKTDVSLGPEIEKDIKNFVKVRLAAHEYPRKIEFVTELPMTTTGKIKRRELKQLEIKRSRQ